MAFLTEVDLSIDREFEKVEKMVDLENFINYYCIQMYINNEDWPGNNHKVWRYTGEKKEDNKFTDGRYRFLLYDTEFSFGLYAGPSLNKVESFSFVSEFIGPDWPNPPASTLLFRKLMENEGFKERFLLTLSDHLNSRFSKTTVKEQIDYFREWYSPEMEEYINRYDFYAMRELKDWEQGLIGDLGAFVDLRQFYMQETAKAFYGLGEYFSLNIQPFEHGKILVNDRFEINTEELATGSKRLSYFSDFEVCFEAIPDEGYTFSGWEIVEDKTNQQKFTIGSSDNEYYRLLENRLYVKPDAKVNMLPIFVEE